MAASLLDDPLDIAERLLGDGSRIETMEQVGRGRRAARRAVDMITCGNDWPVLVSLAQRS